jgi:hypothetical protein
MVSFGWSSYQIKNQTIIVRRTASVYALATLEDAVGPAVATSHVVALMRAAAMACVATIAVRTPLLHCPKHSRLSFGEPKRNMSEVHRPKHSRSHPLGYPLHTVQPSSSLART